jgi:hypothetical protein
MGTCKSIFEKVVPLILRGSVVVLWSVDNR